MTDILRTAPQEEQKPRRHRCSSMNQNVIPGQEEKPNDVPDYLTGELRGMQPVDQTAELNIDDIIKGFDKGNEGRASEDPSHEEIPSRSSSHSTPPLLPIVAWNIPTQHDQSTSTDPVPDSQAIKELKDEIARVKKLNFDLKDNISKLKQQINELENIREKRINSKILAKELNKKDRDIAWYKNQIILYDKDIEWYEAELAKKDSDIEWYKTENTRKENWIVIYKEKREKDINENAQLTEAVTEKDKVIAELMAANVALQEKLNKSTEDQTAIEAKCKEEIELLQQKHNAACEKQHNKYQKNTAGLKMEIGSLQHSLTTSGFLIEELRMKREQTTNMYEAEKDNFSTEIMYCTDKISKLEAENHTNKATIRAANMRIEKLEDEVRTFTNFKTGLPDEFLNLYSQFKEIHENYLRTIWQEIDTKVTKEMNPGRVEILTQYLKLFKDLEKEKKQILERVNQKKQPKKKIVYQTSHTKHLKNK